MTLEVSDFIPGSLEDMDKYIEVADGHHITAEKKVRYEHMWCGVHPQIQCVYSYHLMKLE